MGAVDLDHKVVVADFRCADSDFLQFALVPLRAGLPFFFLLGVHELAVVHDPADRRARLGRNFHQVKACIPCPCKGVGDFYDSKLFVVLVDKTYRRDANSFVAAKAFADGQFSLFISLVPRPVQPLRRGRAWLV